MSKKYNTEEERKEARAISYKKWRAKNKDYQSKWRANNIEKSRETQRKSDDKRCNSCFYVYTHTNSKGDLYIGSGNKRRPYILNRRNSNWLDSFKNDCTVKIIREFKTREDARLLESNMIRAIGLNNLVNKIK